MGDTSAREFFSLQRTASMAALRIGSVVPSGDVPGIIYIVDRIRKQTR